MVVFSLELNKSRFPLPASIGSQGLPGTVTNCEAICMGANFFTVCALPYKTRLWTVVAPSSQAHAIEPQRVRDHGRRAQRQGGTGPGVR